jgi:protocatechuate 3,4-dioxygenase beta subunit
MQHDDDDDGSHHQGLAHDLRRIYDQREARRRARPPGTPLAAGGVSRRQLLGILGGASLALPLFGCLVGDDDATTGTSGSGADAGTTGTGADGGVASGSCETIPSETAGPYPGDGTNGANALSLDGIVRSDIRSSIGGASGVAAGVPLTVRLRLVDVNSGCGALAGHAVYLWHCDRGGNYSMYSSAVAQENYLRGVQETDADGYVTFTTIFPACYSGRWPHIHFEIYADLASATNGQNKIAVSQMAMPEATCNTVFAESGYSASVSNLRQVSLASDNVFSDGATLELPAITGSVAAGYTAILQVAI